MLTEQQQIELKKQVDEKMKTMGTVSQEDMDKYPARREELSVPVSHGTARVISFSHGTPSPERPLFINLHGGGFIGKHMDRDERFCRQIACTYNGLVLDIDYVLAPENPYPAAVEECWDILQWIRAQKEELMYDTGRIFLLGHSSGGNLAVGMCMKAGETDLLRPRALILDYPPLDLVKDPAEKKQSLCDMPAERARGYNRKYIDPARAAEPYASPLYAPDYLLEKLPTTLLITAGEDRLCEEGEEFALRLARAGVTVTSRRFTASVHGFTINRMCEWEKAMALIEGFIAHNL